MPRTMCWSRAPTWRRAPGSPKKTHCLNRIPRRPQSRRARARQRRTGAQVQHRDRFRPARHRRRHAAAPPEHGVSRVRPRLRLCAEYRPVEMVPEAERAQLHGHRARGRPGGDAQFHRHPLHRQLLGDGVRIASPNTSRPTASRDYPNIDGVAGFTHASGCGMELTGEPMDLFRRTLAGYSAPLPTWPPCWSSA